MSGASFTNKEAGGAHRLGGFKSVSDKVSGYISSPPKAFGDGTGSGTTGQPPVQQQPLPQQQIPQPQQPVPGPQPQPQTQVQSEHIFYAEVKKQLKNKGVNYLEPTAWSDLKNKVSDTIIVPSNLNSFEGAISMLEASINNVFKNPVTVQNEVDRAMIVLYFLRDYVNKDLSSLETYYETASLLVETIHGSLLRMIRNPIGSEHKLAYVWGSIVSLDTLVRGVKGLPVLGLEDQAPPQQQPQTMNQPTLETVVNRLSNMVGPQGVQSGIQSNNGGQVLPPLPPFPK